MERTSELVRKVIYIGSEHIISPLGIGAKNNFLQALAGHSAIKHHKTYLGREVNFPYGIIEDVKFEEGMSKMESLVFQTALASLSNIKLNRVDRYLLVISTTKGDIEQLRSNDIEKARLDYLTRRIVEVLPIQMETQVVSNACVSGVSGVVLAHDFIQADKYDHALVIGADLFSEFTVRGFESFFALSSEVCKPFDTNRDGLSLGEAFASVFVSKSRDVFKEKPMQLLGGASANDANHISGPSRTGEGLYRAIEKCIGLAGVNREDIDVISGHGTATRYNDDMESIAFNRCNLAHKPINSLKGYFGHTLGAAGVLEIAMFMQSARAHVMLKNLGCTEQGTVENLNVQMENEERPINMFLKTASGFGGFNAATIIKNLSE